MNRNDWIIGPTVFISAFLLFQVEPLISKHLLPRFGGASSVWTTALAFFQLLLLAGYAYAFFLTKLSVRQQRVIHLLLLVEALSLLILGSFLWNSPVTPGQIIGTGLPPTLALLVILSISIGLPFFLLSTTSTLIQYWISHAQPKTSVYSLYAVSNAGSLLGLISYPFLVEPLLSLPSQGIIWSVVFTAYAGMMGYCLMRFSRNPPPKSRLDTRVPFRLLVSWLLLSTESSLLLTAASHQLTVSLPPIPFLWLLPLTLYIGTFILAFSGKQVYRRDITAIVFLLSAIVALAVRTGGVMPGVWGGIALFTIVLFSGFLLFHAELAAAKPDTRHLPMYYLLLAAGGAAGGIAGGIVAPLVFTQYREFDIAIFGGCIAAVWYLSEVRDSFPVRFLQQRFFQSPKEMKIHAVLTFVTLMVVFPFVRDFNAQFLSGGFGETTIARKRNFYGTLAVTDQKKKDGIEYRVLKNGAIIHGYQYRDENLRRAPNSYYGKQSGIGIAIKTRRDAPGSASPGEASSGASLRIGVVGLGTGTLAVYGEKGDTIRFFEINPDVIDVAHRYFSYLADTEAAVSVIRGDARIALAKELQAGQPPYDILAIDAFTDDAIPIHLLTEEAFRIYADRLAPHGILAVHISNGYLELEPVVASSANTFGFSYTTIDSMKTTGLEQRARWVLVTKDESLADLLQKQAPQTEEKRILRTPVRWSDQYSNLLQVIR